MAVDSKCRLVILLGFLKKHLGIPSEDLVKALHMYSIIELVIHLNPRTVILSLKIID